MFFSSWLRKGTTIRNAQRSGLRRLPARFRPGFEVLEGREVPATVTVTTALDVVDSADGVLSLREAIQQADPATPGGDTIVFDGGLNGQTIILNGNELLIDKNLNIQGPGADQLAINGNYLTGTDAYSRVFEVAANAQVSLTGLTIRNGYARGAGLDSGGGVYNAGTLMVNGCTFSDNSADNHGGAIANVGGTLIVTVSVFSDFNFAAEVGGAISNYYGKASVSDSIFSGNECFASGGAIFNYYNSTLDVHGCNLSGNVAWDNVGGGIANFGTLTVSNCNFFGNSAANPFSGGYADNHGGGIFNQVDATVISSTFLSNSAKYGGGIENNGRLTVNDCTLSGNSAQDGGGINNQNTLTLSGCTLSGNTASYRGGGLLNAGGTFATVNGCTLSGNSAPNGGGIWNYGTLTLSGCNISDNSADIGGGIYSASVSKSRLTVKDSTISGNTATSKGGGLYNAGAATVQNTSVTNNSAVFQGGGIFNDSTGTLTLYSSDIFTGNMAPEGADIDNFGRITRKKG